MGRRAKINAKKRNQRIVYISIAVVVVVASVALALIVSNSFRTPYASYLYKPVPESLYQEITTGVSASTLSAIGGPANVENPATESGAALTLNGKPEILYIGGDFCPYCAVERWAMIQALSHFGNFSGLQYMLSSNLDVNPNSPTFTFSGPAFNYTSQYIAFVPVEEYNRTNEATPWHPLTTQEANLFSAYGTGGFPFIDIANQFVVNGVSTQIDIAGDNWTYVASQLNNSGSSIAQGIDGAANKLTSAICKVDGGVPASVCTQPFATITLAYTSGGSGSTSLAVSSAFSFGPVSEKIRWTS